MLYQDKPPLEDMLMHIGVKRRSGRWPWGSGENPYQHSGDFYSRVQELRKSGFTFTDENGKTLTGDNAIAASMGLSTTQFRSAVGVARNEQRALKVATAKDLAAKGLGATEIGKRMGINESSVRSLLKESSEIKMTEAQATADYLRKQVDKKIMVDVGVGVEHELNISATKMEQALGILEMEGYHVYSNRVPQINNPTKQTTLKVLTTPDKKLKDIYNYGEIKSVTDYISKDGGETFEKKFNYPASMDSKRLQIRYKEDGGIDKDGVVELRPGVEDLSLGKSHYSQVRILVDGNKYIKGMAIYGDPKDFPPGVDVIFNTNKSKSTAKMDVLKDIKDDPDNPFGSAIKDADQGGQYWYTDSKTGEKKLGLINKRADEGDWNKWTDTLSAQFLSKQNVSLAKRQINESIKDRQKEFDEIMALTNPTVKKKLLEDFAEGCDSTAVHLEAASLPRQKYHVIMPITTLKDNEIYAPKYKDGEQVALVRYPHAGTFEIPILTVNNKQRDAKRILGPDVADAVGINSKVAERLSGADFDGDTVMVIPTNSKVKITSTRQLPDLEGFDPKMEYGTKAVKTGVKDEKGKEIVEYYNAQGKAIKVMKNTQNEMGRISNLISDMTLQGADEKELARAVKHSMVIIDAEKHHLDYKQSEIDNDIATLKSIYQSGGASTLISRAKSQSPVLKRQGSPSINVKGRDNYDPTRPEGALLWKTADDLYMPVMTTNKKTGVVTIRTADGGKVTYNKTDRDAAAKYRPTKHIDPDTGAVSYTSPDGTLRYKIKERTQKSTEMEKTDDARTLISDADTQMERLYADYANTMKAMANQARLETVYAGKIAVNRKAKQTYAAEVASLQKKLEESLLNKPRERQAQLIANSVLTAKKQANPDMSNDEIKKAGQQALTRARQMVGAQRKEIVISDREWEAIQAGAISESSLKKILDRADMDIVRQKATPRSVTRVSNSKISRIHSMQDSGLTINEIASALNLSPSTVIEYMN